ncbi:MAG: phytanoyl-CoA dioxygenase family protein, partial [Pyrinomonadaceae bacterium]
MAEDLSTRHGLVGNLLTLPATPEGWARYRLSDEQVRFFHEYGYLKGIRMITDEQVEVLRGELSALMDPSH